MDQTLAGLDPADRAVADVLPSATMCVAPGTASTPSYGVLSSMNHPHAAAKLQPRGAAAACTPANSSAATGRLLHHPAVGESQLEQPCRHRWSR